jgi:PEP-CTERM motif
MRKHSKSTSVRHYSLHVLLAPRALLSRALVSLVIAATALWAMPTRADGQVFVATWVQDKIGEYTTSGLTINASLVSAPAVNTPFAMAASGGDLFAVEYPNTIGEYTTTGQTVNSALITGVTPDDIAVSGSDIFVANSTGTIGEYTTSGVPVNPSLITLPPDGLYHIAVSDGDIFVAVINEITSVGMVSEYTTAGATVNTSLITGIIPGAIAVSGGNIFLALGYADAIGEYTTSGTPVNASLITESNYVPAIAVLGDKLFALTINNSNIGTVSEFTTAGATVNPSLVSGFVDLPQGLAVAPPLLGDVNFDGIVNGQDIAQVASHWLQAGPSLSDTNGDNIVNGGDLSAIASNWLQTPGTAGNGTAAPEPSTLILAALGGLALLANCRRR